MPKIIITASIILLCLSRTTSYAVYAFREKNILAGIGALTLSVAASVSSVMFLM